MVNEKRAVTINDKKKAKSTCVLFASFATFFLAGTILSSVFTPKANKVVGINGDDTDSIRTFTSFNDGDEFIATNSETLQRFSMENNEVLQSIPYQQEIRTMLSNNNEYFNASFDDVSIHYQAVSSDDGYLLVFDSDGDIFKYDYDGTELSLNSDYWLTDRVMLGGKLYQDKCKISSLEIDNNDLYVLYTINSNFVVNVYDVNNLNAGVQKTKTLISLAAPDKDQKVEYGKNCYVVNRVATKRHVYSFAIDGDMVSLLTGQGVTRWNKDLLDYVNEGESLEISYLNDATNYVVDGLRNELLADTAKLSELGLTSEFITNAKEFVIKQVYQYAYGSDQFVVKERDNAKAFKLANSWVIEYDPIKDIYVVNSSYFDDTRNLEIETGSEQTMGGSCYSLKNKEVYYLDLKSNTLYSYPISSLKTLNSTSKKTISDISKKTKVSYSGTSFYDMKGNITYDRVTNNVHVFFYSSRNISIIDINGDEPVEKITFAFEYDIRSFISNKDGSRLAAMYQIEKRTIKNVASFPLNISVVNPESYQYRTLFVILFVACIVLFAVSLIVLFVSLKAYRRTMTMLKLKVIKRDLKRNKWTYVALIPFITLLIMFCYIEAVGSISFSFFSYTQQKPSYVWNTFGNYIEIFNDSKFWLMFGNTAFFLVFDLFLGIVPPIIFAFFLSIIKRQKLSGVLRALMFIPAVVPGIATLLIWKVGIFGDTGVLNQLILFFKTGKTVAPAGYTPINFLHDESLSRWSLLLMGFPYVGGYLIFYGGIMNIPKEYDEACQLEGVGVIKRFITIDLPLIKPQVKYIFVMGILNSVQNYERTYMLGSNGTTTLVESMYRQMKDVGNPNYGLASAYATIIFLLLLFPVLWNFSRTKKDTMGDI